MLQPTSVNELGFNLVFPNNGPPECWECSCDETQNHVISFSSLQFHPVFSLSFQVKIRSCICIPNYSPEKSPWIISFLNTHVTLFRIFPLVTTFRTLVWIKKLDCLCNSKVSIFIISQVNSDSTTKIQRKSELRYSVNNFSNKSLPTS